MTTSDNEWQRVVQRMATSGATSDNEWERVATNDNEWQRVTASGTTNEISIVHFREWMIAMLSMTEIDTLLQRMDGYS